MASSKLYENKEEEGLHARTIRFLSTHYGVTENEIKELYERELEELKQSARIKGFLSVLIARRIKRVFSAGRTRHS